MIQLLLLLLLNLTLINASIIESSNLAQVVDFWEPGALIIFDIDNTLVHPKGRIGSDEWFVYMLQDKQREGKSFKEALHDVLLVYCEIQYGIDMQLIDPTTPALIAQLQTEEKLVIALTARTLPLVQRTIDQLDAVAIDFSHNHIGMPFIIRELANPYVYKRGVLFSGQNNKGEVLVDFLTHCRIHPTKIIFVDDKLYNLQAVMQAAERLEIPFVGLRYNVLDEHIATIDKQTIDEELYAFYHK